MNVYDLAHAVSMSAPSENNMNLKELSVTLKKKA